MTKEALTAAGHDGKHSFTSLKVVTDRRPCSD
jgi:hypothetical protein